MSAHLRGKFPCFRLCGCKILSLAVTTRTEKRYVKKKTTERDNVQLRENVIKALPCGGPAGPSRKPSQRRPRWWPGHPAWQDARAQAGQTAC